MFFPVWIIYIKTKDKGTEKGGGENTQRVSKTRAESKKHRRRYMRRQNRFLSNGDMGYKNPKDQGEESTERQKY